MEIRNYRPEDYFGVEKLYKDSSTYGGEFDESRDTPERLNNLVAKKTEAILVAEDTGEIVGTVTLFEDGRSAWLYRFAVSSENEIEISKALWIKASEVMKTWGHKQVLVYAPARDNHFQNRYESIGFTKGNDFTAYYQNLE